MRSGHVGGLGVFWYDENEDFAAGRVLSRYAAYSTQGLGDPEKNAAIGADLS